MSAAAEALQPRLLGALMLRRWPWWMALLLPWLLLRAWPGLLLAVLLLGLDFWHLRQRARRDWPRWLDAAVPELEDSSALLDQAESPLARLQQQRLLNRLAVVVNGEALKRIARTEAPFDWRWLALSLGAAGLLWLWPQPSSSNAPAVAEPAAALGNELTLRVMPPAYTGVAALETAPKALQVPENSEIRWCLRTTPPQPAAIELSDGSRLSLASGCATWQATEAMFWRWQGQRYTVLVTPDLAPRISIESPDELIHVLARDARAARIAVTVSDDYRLERASLHLTLARGSGENIRFSDREVPLPQSADPRQRRWDKTWLLSELGMEPGDELYFFVRASDNAAPRPHLISSPTYTLRLPGPQAAETESSALPMLVKPETLRSQRQIIIDTEQLLSEMKGKGLPPGQLRARSESIAADQGQLRRRYGQFLGEESSLFGDDHGDEHGADDKQDVLHRFGHAHDQAENATLFDEATKKILRRALSAMWEAEKGLRAITPQPALPHEYRALEAIKQLQQADRIYLHRTAFAPPPIKEEKRMTGDALGAASYRREQGAAPETVPAPLRELMTALAGDHPLPALWSGTAQDWIRERIRADEDRLAAQRALQDVMDGCGKCRPALRAWLRSGITEPGIRLQAEQGTATPFSKAWQERRAP